MFFVSGQCSLKSKSAIIILLFVLTNSTKSNYETHVNHLRTIIGDERSARVLHVPFTDSSDDPSPALGATSKVGVSEIIFPYFLSSLTRKDRTSLCHPSKNRGPLWNAPSRLPCTDPGPQAKGLETSQVYVTVVGWVDIDAHVRFQASDDFLQNIHHILAVKGMRHTEIFHAKMQAI